MIKLFLETWIACPRLRFKFWQQVTEIALVRQIRAYVNAEGAWTFEPLGRVGGVVYRQEVEALMALAVERVGQPKNAITYRFVA